MKTEQVDRGALRPSRPYEYMPASIDSTDKALTIGVRFEKNKKTSYEKNRNGIIMRFPDRTLYCFRSFMPSHDRMMDQKVDYVQEMDIFTNKGLLGEMGFKYAMVNASAVPSTYFYDNYDLEKQDLWPLIVSDSGGFQLHSGKEHFLNPHEIVKNHNRLCDIGIVLDLPLPHRFQKDLLLRAADMQKKNNAIFIKEKRKSLEFLNVFHGSTFYMRQKYRDIVEDSAMDRVALGGVKTLDLIPLALHTLFVVMNGRKYKQYHVLGVSGLERWVILSYIGHKKLAKLITSDSSSYIQCGINMQYFEPQKLLSTVHMGDYGRACNANRTLHCSCPVCNTIKYAHGMALTESIGFRGVLTHNLYTNRSYLDEIWELGAQPKQEILTYLRPYFNKKKLETIGLALQAVDMAIEDGVKKAAERYAPYLLDKYVGVEKKGLFNVEQDSKEDKKLFARFDGILSRYEAFHKSGKVPKAG
jgi:hypothetical protein